MSSIHRSVASPWSDGATIHRAGPSLPWGAGATIHATPSAYTPGAPAAGGTTTGPTAGAALYTIASRATYDVPHTMVVTDLRDDTVLAVDQLTVSIDEDSALWTLRATGGNALYAKLTTGEQPAQVEVDLDGEIWVFVIDSVSREREFGQVNVSISGRSAAVAAGSPYEADQNWVNDGVSTGAQIAAMANLYTGLAVSWELEDWLVPDRVFSFSGTPLAVVLRVAEAVGAMVQADRTTLGLRVMARYPILPNEWPTVAPDVEIAFDAVLSERYERSDRPEYTGVYVSGQQQGAVGFVRLAGTSGSNLHPLVTDLLLTDAPALRMRGEAILGASGGQARMTLGLPLLTGAGEPGALSVGQLARVLDPDGAWHGMVRSVSISASLPTVVQTVVLERHTKDIDGSVYVPPAAPAGRAFDLRTADAGMSHVGQYQSDFYGSVPLGGTFDTSQVGTDVVFDTTLTATCSAASTAMVGTVNKDSGDPGPFYFEVGIGTTNDLPAYVGAFVPLGTAFDPNVALGGVHNTVYRSDGSIDVYGSVTGGFATFAAGDSVGVVIDPYSSQVTFYLNGTFVAAVSLSDDQNISLLCGTWA